MRAMLREGSEPPQEHTRAPWVGSSELQPQKFRAPELRIQNPEQQSSESKHPELLNQLNPQHSNKFLENPKSNNQNEFRNQIKRKSKSKWQESTQKFTKSTGQTISAETKS